MPIFTGRSSDGTGAKKSSRANVEVLPFDTIEILAFAYEGTDVAKMCPTKTGRVFKPSEKYANVIYADTRGDLRTDVVSEWKVISTAAEFVAGLTDEARATYTAVAAAAVAEAKKQQWCSTFDAMLELLVPKEFWPKPSIQFMVDIPLDDPNANIEELAAALVLKISEDARSYNASISRR